jgi:drug/metabolite transporter (DMT)-like permease
VAVVVAALILGQQLTTVELAGGAAILVAVVLAQRPTALSSGRGSVRDRP